MAGAHGGRGAGDRSGRLDAHVYGEVEREAAFTLAELRPRAVERACDIHCVTRWSRFDMRWEGARVRDLLEPTPHATHALIHSYGGYSTNLPLEALLDDDVLVAWAADGEPLAHEHGGPLRLLVPRRYFWKSAKYLQAIELLDHDEPDMARPPTQRLPQRRRVGGADQQRTHADPLAFRALRRRARGVSRP